MAEDANAAIRGAFDGGATDVLVNDSHGGQRNLLPEDLDPRARLISHSFKRHGMMEGLDESFDAVIFVGYHAKADAPRGLFAHTGSGVVRDLQINGRSVGEGGMNAALAAWYGVPVVAVSGDDVAIAEVKESVAERARRSGQARDQHARGRAEAACRSRGARFRKPRATASLARRRRRAAAQGPFKVQLRYRNFTFPEVATAFREIELVAPDTVAFTRDIDARGVSPDSRALPLHQSGLTVRSR